jgi:hypothetical protein
MSFNVTVDTSKVEKRLADMVEKLKKLGTEEIGIELTNWQSADMHRKKPRTRVWARGKRASTVIRPHSIAEMKRSHQSQMRARRRRRGPLPAKHWSTRPILRDELYQRLAERMRALLATIRW